MIFHPNISRLYLLFVPVECLFKTIPEFISIFILLEKMAKFYNEMKIQKGEQIQKRRIYEKCGERKGRRKRKGI